MSVMVPQSPATQLFVQQSIQANIKENFKATPYLLIGPF